MVKLTIAMVVIVGAVAAWAFEPWRLWTHSTIDEPLPSVAGAPVAGAPSVREMPVDQVPAPTQSSGAASAPPASASPEPPDSPEPPEPPEPEVVELGSGSFVDAEHGTSGVAKIIELSDGSRFVRIEDLDSSDGPDLFVWLSDAPSGGSWGSYDDGRYVSLGSLKATNGNQNYPIPADVDLGGLRTVVIWCDRFNVAFGTAPIAA